MNSLYLRNRMNPISPLQLRDYYIESLHVEANKSFKADGNKLHESALIVDFDFRKRDDYPLFRIDLDVRINPTEESFRNAPYRIHIRTQTYLDFDPSTPESEIARMIGPNGLAMAYAIARGIVGQATGTSLHGKFLLPTVNFVELIRAKAKHSTTKLSAKKRKRG